MEATVDMKNLLDNLIYYPFVALVFVFFFIYYTLVNVEKLFRHHGARYIRLWKEEINR